MGNGFDRLHLNSRFNLLFPNIILLAFSLLRCLIRTFTSYFRNAVVIVRLTFLGDYSACQTIPGFDSLLTSNQPCMVLYDMLSIYLRELVQRSIPHHTSFKSVLCGSIWNAKHALMRPDPSPLVHTIPYLASLYSFMVYRPRFNSRKSNTDDIGRASHESGMPPFPPWLKPPTQIPFRYRLIFISFQGYSPEQLHTAIKIISKVRPGNPIHSTFCTQFLVVHPLSFSFYTQFLVVHPLSSSFSLNSW